MNYPLKDMKILDFSQLLPGPFGTMILADFGADVIKVENFRNPDFVRIMPPMIDNISAVHAHLNRGKKSLALNLKDDDAKKIIYKLVEEYDIIIEQFRPGAMERLGLGYDRLKKINDSIIYCSLTGYGQAGTYAQKAGHDINYLALSGIVSYSGRDGKIPPLNGIQIADVAGGSNNLVIAILMAYIKRLKSGMGDYIDISITDSAFSLTAFQAAGFLAGGSIPVPESDFLNGGNFYDYYRTSDDRYVSVGPIEPKFFNIFCEKLDIKGVKYDNIDFSGNLKGIKKTISDKISLMSLEQVNELFKDVDACVEPVLHMDEVICKPPVSERDMILSIKNENGKIFRQIASPIKFKSGKMEPEFAGTSLGYHNNDILKSLDYPESLIKQLKEAGAII